MVHHKIAHKYFFKVFYRRINKKNYKLLILMYNICHINIIAMQNSILMEKVLDRIDKKSSLLLIYRM